MPIIPPSGGGGSSLTIAEVDGSPSLTATTLVVSNASLTDSGGGTATLVTGAGTAAAAFSGAKAYATAAQSITTGVFTAVLLDSELYDTASYHSTVTNTSRLTVPQDGYYAFGAQASFQASAGGSGQRFVGITYNGGTTTADYLCRNSMPGTGVGGGGVRHVSTAGAASLGSGTYIEAYVYQDSGGTVTLGGSAQGTASFWIQYLGS